MNKEALIAIILDLSATRITVPPALYDTIVSDMNAESIAIEIGEEDSFIRFYQGETLVHVGSCFEWGT